MSDPVILSRGDAVWRLTLNRPDKRNALSPEIIEAVLAALDVVERERPHGLIVTGAGPVFCAGLDLAGIESASDGDMLWRILRIEMLLQKLWALPCRTLGLAQKAAIGAGADLLTACQTRILTPDGRMAFPGLGFGIFLGTNRLALRIGATAAETVLTKGAPVAAPYALDLGLIHQMADNDTFAACAADWSTRVAALDPHVAAYLGNTAAPLDPAADMDALVRSAARPGLRDRISAFAAAQKPRRAPRTQEMDT